MKKYLPILIALSCFSSCAQTSTTNPDSVNQEIRGVQCQIANKDFSGAQTNLEKILQKDAANIFARRLLPGVLAKQVKKDDKSAENVARIRKAIDSYQQSLNTLKVSPKERAYVNLYVIDLYKKIGEEEGTKELLKRSADSKESPEDRSQFFTALAAQSNTCANEITADAKTLPKPEIEKARACVAKGLEYAEQATTLNGNSESAWSYKASLLTIASRIAGLDKDQVQKDSYKKQADVALKRFKEISAQQREEQQKEDEQLLTKERSGPADFPTEELTEYRAEKPLDEMIDSIDVPFDEILVAPLSDTPSGDNKKDDVPPPLWEQKREWREFAPKDADFAAELPDNVTTDPYGKITHYTAGSDGMQYEILAQPRPDGQPSNVDDVILNTLAWAYVIPKKNMFVNLGESRFEVKLLRKEAVAGQPARVYSYAISSCRKNTDGTLIVLIGKKYNYVIDVQGANETDPRAQRFLKSMKFK